MMMQAVMGTLVKRFLGKQLGLDPAQIYHCAIMPCYDKKLEGSRDDFFVPGMFSLLILPVSCTLTLTVPPSCSDRYQVGISLSWLCQAAVAGSISAACSPEFWVLLQQ